MGDDFGAGRMIIFMLCDMLRRLFGGRSERPTPKLYDRRGYNPEKTAASLQSADNTRGHVNMSTTMSQQQWDQVCKSVSAQMRLQMMPFVTPLPRAMEDGGGELIGSGSYVEHVGRQLLLTNQHVMQEGLGTLTHKHFDSSTYFLCSPFTSQPWPLDLAAARAEPTWRSVDHSAMTFPEHRFAHTHAPASGELLFLMGFAGSRSYYSPTANQMLTHGTPFLSQEFDPIKEGRQIISPDFDPNYHFAIPWQPATTQVVEGDTSTVPLSPKGFSGSPVWNTRFMEYSMAGVDWTPGVARLTGIAWAWESADRAIFVTRVEHVRTFLAGIP